MMFVFTGISRFAFRPLLHVFGRNIVMNKILDHDVMSVRAE